MKILVIGPSWVGDMVMSQSLYRTLKAKHVTASIDVMAPQWCLPLLNRMPEVNQALLMPLGHGRLALGQRRRLGIALREKNYDRAYVLPNSFKSALIPFFAAIPQRIGWRGEIRYGLLNDIRILNTLAFPMMVQRYVALAYDKQAISSSADLSPLLRPQLHVSNAEQIAISHTFALNPHRSIIGLCPGAEFGPAKRWPHYHYAALAQQLINDGYQIILLGSPKDHQVAQEICLALDENNRDYCFNLAGQTSLEQVVILIAACHAIVSNDSGLMHIAAALDKPLIALYGPSNPEFTPPLSDKAVVIRLIKGYQRIRRGDADQGYHQSLIDIKPEQVVTALYQQLFANSYSKEK
ncbi:ADP-heptose--LPS heptosyltransferase RfaF [Candidatus Regiella endosymbiont of Tuberolachnus salignus]|uniref:ADP-heptose--LPS heptosyltransferase RfaF n=1 Tax=Candidatus Regiella endosymbiont of Tuberolachnus salignus TaxID=3077956 RepID=UPI0030D411E7